MVSLTSLVVPIFLSAVIVFVASFVLHMVLPFHKSDIRRLPKEHESTLLEAVRRMSLSSGDYGAPHPGSPAGMKDPDFVSRMTKGPIVLMTVTPGQAPSMAPNLAQWFVLVVIVNFFAAYVASRAVAPASDYLTVFRFVGTTTFMGYSLGVIQESIWYKRRWGRTMMTVVDGLVYALLAAGVFGWLWPGR